MVGKLIGLRLMPLFGDNHADAMRFYAELEKTAPLPQYNPMQRN